MAAGDDRASYRRSICSPRGVRRRSTCPSIVEAEFGESGGPTEASRDPGQPGRARDNLSGAPSRVVRNPLARSQRGGACRCLPETERGVPHDDFLRGVRDSPTKTLARRAESFELDRFPVPVDRSDYRGCARHRGTAGEHSWLCCDLRLGGLSAPGISDLDRIAVVGSRRSDFVDLARASQQRERYVALHTPFLVDAETFRRTSGSRISNPRAARGCTVHLEEPPRAIRCVDRLIGLEGSCWRVSSSRSALRRTDQGSAVLVRAPQSPPRPSACSG